MSTKNENKNKPMPALMRKTKAQLVEIILRKDNIECGLRNDIKGSEKTLNSYKEKLVEANHKLDAKNQDYDILKAEYESICDENASTICELKETIKNKTSIIFKLYIGLIVSFTIILFLCCFLKAL